MLAPGWCGDVNRRKSMHKVTEIMSSCFVFAKFNQDGPAYIWAIFCSHWEWSELKSINIYVSNWIAAWEPSQQGRLGVTGKPMNRGCEEAGMDPNLLYSLWDPTSISRSLGKLFWDWKLVLSENAWLTIRYFRYSKCPANLPGQVNAGHSLGRGSEEVDDEGAFPGIKELQQPKCPSIDEWIKKMWYI